MSELQDQEIKQFLEWEQASRDTIDVKRIYIDLAGDLVTGILLSQIIYWFLPSKGESKLRVQREGRFWLAKLRSDWWEECRISPKQFDRSIQILREKGLVETKRFQFKGAIPTLHIWLNISSVVQGVKSILLKGENPSSPNGEMHLTESVKLSTETTDIDYDTEIEESNYTPYFKEMVRELWSLPYFYPKDLHSEVVWLIEFSIEYPEFKAQHVRECRDFWDGRRAKDKGIWKNRLRNWCKKAREIATQPTTSKTATVKKRLDVKVGQIPTDDELDKEAK